MANRRPARTLAEVEALEQQPWETLASDWTTYGLLRDAAERHADLPSVDFLADAAHDRPAVRLSYRDLFAAVTCTANALFRLGVGKADPVAILLPNLVETHLSLWGAQAAGIAAPVNPLLEPAQIAGLLNRIQARILVTTGPRLSPDLWDKALAVAALVPGLTAILAVGGAGDVPAGTAPAVDFHKTIAAEPADHLVSGRVIAPEDPAAYFMTGGTTGAPKVAIQIHRNQAFQARIVAEQNAFQPGDVLLAGLPMFHVNAVMVTGLSVFAGGGSAVLLTAQGYRNKAVIENFWAIADRCNARTFSAVPTILAALLEQPRAPGQAACLRDVVCGAAPLPLELYNRFEEMTGIHIREGYGQTEGTCVTSCNPAEGERLPGSVGLRLPYQQVRCVTLLPDGTLADCAVGETGRVVLKGPHVFAGYLDPRDNRDCWYADGWFDSGDLGRFDERGYLWLTGRSKDLIIRGGHNIDPQMIEETLSAHPGVALAAAVGQPDAYAGELPVAFVMPRPGVVLSAAEVMAFTRSRIQERAACPVRVEVIDTMPVTPVGKIHKPTLRLEAVRRMVALALSSAGLEGEVVSVTVEEGHFAVTIACPDGTTAAVHDLLEKLPLRVTVDGR